MQAVLNTAGKNGLLENLPDVRIVKMKSCSFLVACSMVIVLALLAPPVVGAMGPAMGGVDIPGNNIRSVVLATREECSAACDAEAACVAATFVLPGTIQGPDGHCYLKSASTPQVDNFNCYSFVKLTALPVILGCVMSNPSAEFDMLAAGNKPPRGFAPLVVQFTDASTGAAGWSWDFGDGSALSHDKNPVHTYTAGGPDGIFYDVTLTVTGSCPGETSVKKKSQIIRVFDNLGFLGLASTPGGASAYVDGVLMGKTVTGTTDEPLHIAPGSHTVRLTLDGYKDYTGTVTVVNGQVTALSPVLEKITGSLATSSPATGSLQITTAPDGAVVTVDGAAKGTTPLTVPGLATGSHAVRLTKAGYTDYAGTLTLAGGKTTLLNITLVPAQETPASTAPPGLVATGTASPPVTAAPAGTGSLSVQSTPPGANVYLDGENVGTTPVLVPGVAPGTHRLVLTLQGYNDMTRPVEITGGAEKEVHVSFPAKKVPGFAAPLSLAALVLVLLGLPGRRKGW